MVDGSSALATDSRRSEELARAEVYGLLARLFSRRPTTRCTPVAGGGDRGAGARRVPRRQLGELVAAARRAAAGGGRDEYDALFLGIGKPEVFLYGSYYLAGLLNEKPLVALRADLAALGLTRDAAMAETEDHVAYLFEVMRCLIAGDDLSVCNLASQQRFFSAHSAAVVRRFDARPLRRTRRPISTARWRCSRATFSKSNRRLSTCSKA